MFVELRFKSFNKEIVCSLKKYTDNLTTRVKYFIFTVMLNFGRRISVFTGILRLIVVKRRFLEVK
jgi:hypothetical protein